MPQSPLKHVQSIEVFYKQNTVSETTVQNHIQNMLNIQPWLTTTAE